MTFLALLACPEASRGSQADPENRRGGKQKGKQRASEKDTQEGTGEQTGERRQKAMISREGKPEELGRKESMQEKGMQASPEKQAQHPETMPPH